MALVKLVKALVCVATNGSLFAPTMHLVLEKHAFIGLSLTDDFRESCLLSALPESANYLPRAKKLETSAMRSFIDEGATVASFFIEEHTLPMRLAVFIYLTGV